MRVGDKHLKQHEVYWIYSLKANAPRPEWRTWPLALYCLILSVCEALCNIYFEKFTHSLWPKTNLNASFVSMTPGSLVGPYMYILGSRNTGLWNHCLLVEAHCVQNTLRKANVIIRIKAFLFFYFGFNHPPERLEFNFCATLHPWMKADYTLLYQYEQSNKVTNNDISVVGDILLQNDYFCFDIQRTLSC